MGQINVSADDKLIAGIDRVAAAMGKSRTDLLRQAMHEIVEAHAADRLAFAREEGPRLDASISALAGQLREGITELDRAQRENAKIAKRLIDAWNGGEEAARAAQDRITDHINQRFRDGYEPYRLGVNDLLERVQALPGNLVTSLGERLGAIDHKLAENRELAKQPRTANYFALSDAWQISFTALGIVSMAIFLIGCACGFALSGPSNEVSKDPVLAIVPTPAAACRVVNYVFASKDCRIPEGQRQSAVDALRQEQRR